MFRRSDVRRSIENRGSCPQTAGGVPPTGTDECAGVAAVDTVAAVAQTDDPAGSIPKKGIKGAPMTVLLLSLLLENNGLSVCAYGMNG